MLSNLIKNWKTSSVGVLTLATAIVHLWFTPNRGEADWTFAITQMLVGVGFLFAGDSSINVQAHAVSTAAIKDLQSQVSANADALLTGNTEQVTKIQAGQSKITAS